MVRVVKGKVVSPQDKPSIFTLACMTAEEFDAYLFSAAGEKFLLASQETAVFSPATAMGKKSMKRAQSQAVEAARQRLKSGYQAGPEDVQKMVKDMARILHVYARMMAWMDNPDIVFNKEIVPTRDCGPGLTVSINTFDALRKLAPEKRPQTLADKAEFLAVPGRAFFNVQGNIKKKWESGKPSKEEKNHYSFLSNKEAPKKEPKRYFSNAIVLGWQLAFPLFDPGKQSYPQNFSLPLLARSGEERERLKSLPTTDLPQKFSVEKTEGPTSPGESSENGWIKEALHSTEALAEKIVHPKDAIWKKNLFRHQAFREAAAHVQAVYIALMRYDDPLKGWELPDIQKDWYPKDGVLHQNLYDLALSTSDDIKALSPKEKMNVLDAMQISLAEALHEMKDAYHKTAEGINFNVEKSIVTSETANLYRTELRQEALENWEGSLRWNPRDFRYGHLNSKDSTTDILDPRVKRFMAACQIYGASVVLADPDRPDSKSGETYNIEGVSALLTSSTQPLWEAYKRLNSLIEGQNVTEPDIKGEMAQRNKAVFLHYLNEVERAKLCPNTVADVRERFGLDPKPESSATCTRSEKPFGSTVVEASRPTR